MANESLVKIRHSMTLDGLEPYWLRLVRLQNELQAKTWRDLLIRLIPMAEARIGKAKAEGECPVCGRKFERDQKQTVTVQPSSA